MTKGHLLLLRHAETDLAGTFCGSSDPAINAHGSEQISKLLEAMPQRALDVVYSSDLQRAINTATPIAARFGGSVCIKPELREINFGTWEALTWTDVEQRDPVYAQAWLDQFPRLPAVGGEPIECFESRVLQAFDALVSLDQCAAIVTHAGVLRAILKHRCRMTEERAWLQTRAYCSFFQYPECEVLHDRT